MSPPNSDTPLRAGRAMTSRPALLLATILSSTACAEPEGTPRHALLITLDATRADALSAYGGSDAHTPHLDALAARGLRFSQAVSTTPYTGSAHASILTGLFPPQHGMRDFMQQRLSEEALTLPEILQQRGFATAAFISGYPLVPSFGFRQGFDYYGAAVWQPPAGGEAEPAQKPERFIERRAENTVSEALHWLEAQTPGQPLFAWVHLYDPHAPYDPPAAFRSARTRQADPLAAERARYYAEATYMDAEIGRLFAALRRLRLYRDLVIAVVADHGELLGEHGREIRTHSTMLVDATMRVPLILRVPGVEAAVVDSQVRIIDVFPTLLRALSVPVPQGIEGRDLLRHAAEDAGDLPAYSETFYEHFPQRAAEGQELTSLRHRGFKLVQRPGREELFDLDADADELRDCSAEHPDELARLRTGLGALKQRWPPDMRPTALDLPPDQLEEHLEKLRALGYVE